MPIVNLLGLRRHRYPSPLRVPSGTIEPPRELLEQHIVALNTKILYLKRLSQQLRMDWMEEDTEEK